MRELAEIGGLTVAGILPTLFYLGIGLGLAEWMAPGAGAQRRALERLVWAYALGTGAASLAILGLRAVDLSVSIPLALLATAGVLFAARRRGRAADTEPRESSSPAPAWVRWLDRGSVALAALLFLAALGPETYWDGFEYHLPMVQAWTEAPIRSLPGLLDAEFRAGVDLLYVPALELGQPDAAAAVTAGFAIALAALVRLQAGRRAGEGAGACASFFCLIVPFTLLNAPSTYTDLGVGLYGALALLAVDAWNRDGDRRELWLAAVAIAFAANAKLHAAILAPAAAILLLGGRRPGPALALRCAAITLGLALPWLAKAWATSGNPLFPLFPERLGSGFATPLHLSLRRFRLSTDLPVARDLAGFLYYLASLTFGRNPHFSGQLGPLPLALAPLALGGITRSAAVLTGVAVALCLGMWLYMPALRFGAPLLPLLAIATAVGGARLARSGSVPHGLLAGLLVLVGLYQVSSFAEVVGPRLVALRQPHAYERAVFPDQDGLRTLVNRAHGKVAIPKGAVLWLSQPAYVLHWERNGEIFFDRLLRHRTPPARVLEVLEGHGVTAVAMDVRAPPPGGGGIGHPTVDAWIRAGRARLRPDADPPRARGDRRWVLIDLIPAESGGRAAADAEVR